LADHITPPWTKTVPQQIDLIADKLLITSFGLSPRTSKLVHTTLLET